MLGSVTAEVDQTQTRTYESRYSAYGRNNWSTGTGCGFGWVGSRGYRETGLFNNSHYVRARHYSYLTGIWTTVDPLWPDEKAYVYVSGRVSRGIDPSGTAKGVPCIDCALGIYSTLGGKNGLHGEGQGPFSHCLASCILTSFYGPKCATASQAGQEILPCKWPDSKDRNNLRDIPCGTGISIGGQIRPGPDTTSKCATKCWEEYWDNPPKLPRPKPKPNRKPPRPPVPLPGKNPPGCGRDPRPVEKFRKDRDRLLDEIDRDGIPNPCHWWLK
jgi:RHS repeat-associated protein